MATPYRISNVARRILFRSQNFSSIKLLSRGFNRPHFQIKLKVTFGLFSFPAAFVSLSVMAGVEDNKALIEEIEALYDKKDFDAMYDRLLPHKESKDANVMWRLARAATEKGKMLGGDDKKKHIYEAFEYAKEALKLDENNFACHKWYGILLDYTAEYEGNKKRISNAYLVKEHFMKAIELNPSDATTMYCLGYWCFLFADMPWYQRKIAGALFASPPTSTYEEALKYFEDAEKAEPGFYSTNSLMRAKTRLRMKTEKDKAKELLQAVIDAPLLTKDAENARKEATDLIKGL